jgi:thiol-disulfide isomerase/thioredoxin
VRFETTSQTGSYAVVSDGKTLWRAAVDSREFMRGPVEGPLLETKGGGPEAEASLRFLKAAMGYIGRLEDNLRRAQRVGTETVEVGGKRIECVVVRADCDPPRLSTGIGTWTRTFWIDEERGVILREESFTRGSLVPSRPFEQSESRHARRYLVASLNEPVPDSVFVYSPPANFREVDRLERAFPRPATELIGKEAPELTLQTLTGETLKLADFRGKIVLLDFWATWCGPCRTQMPALSKLHEALKDQGVELLGVNDDATPQQASEFLNDGGYNWVNLYDGKEKEARTKFKVIAIPTLVLIDPKGIIVDYQIGSGHNSEQAIRSGLRNLGVELP